MHTFRLLVRPGYPFRPALLRPKYFRHSPASPASATMSSQGTFNGKEEHDKTCEEPLSLPAEEGYGYYPSAVVGHRLGQYEIVRKVSVSISEG